MPGLAPSASGTSVSATVADFREPPTSSSSPCLIAAPASRVSTRTLASPKSGSTARTRTVTGAPGGTLSTFASGTSIDTSGARSGTTSTRCSRLPMTSASDRPGAPARGL